MAQKSTKLTFRPVWRFPIQVEQRIIEFMELHPGKWLHAPIGDSAIGRTIFPKGCDVITLDLDPNVNPQIVGDIFHLSEHPEIQKLMPFDGVISDPVWLKIETCANCKDPIETKKGLSYPTRRKLSYSVRDVLKIDGWWIFNGLWDPSCKGMEFAGNEMTPSGVEVPFQNFNSYRNLPYLAYLKRVPTDA